MKLTPEQVSRLRQQLDQLLEGDSFFLVIGDWEGMHILTNETVSGAQILAAYGKQRTGSLDFGKR